MILGRSGCRERLWQLPRALRAYVTLRASTCEGPCPLDVYFCFTLPWHSSSHPCTCIHTQTPKHVRTCIREHAHSHTHMHIDTCTHAHMHTYTSRHMHAHMRSHTYTSRHMRAGTHTHPVLTDRGLPANSHMAAQPTSMHSWGLL